MRIKLISTSTDWGNKLPEEYGNLQKTDFSYQLIGLLVNYETNEHPYCLMHNKQVYSYLKTFKKRNGLK